MKVLSTIIIHLIIFTVGSKTCFSLIYSQTKIKRFPTTLNSLSERHQILQQTEILFTFPVKMFTLEDLSILNNLLTSEPFRLVLTPGYHLRLFYKIYYLLNII